MHERHVPIFLSKIAIQIRYCLQPAAQSTSIVDKNTCMYMHVSDTFFANLTIRQDVCTASTPLTFENPLLLHTYIYEVTLNAMFIDSLYDIVVESTIKSLCQRRDRSPDQFRARGVG
jgi:hypothetical protein